MPEEPKSSDVSIVETEAKHRVANPALLRNLLEKHGFVAGESVLQRDEYYDTEERAMDKLDWVIRLRKDSSRLQIGMKGPRFYTTEGEYSRIELEIEPRSEESIRRELGRKNLDCTWFFEKRRTEYASDSIKASVVIDEIPEVGYFLEVEGSLDVVRRLTKFIAPALGEQETRNYKEIFVAYQEAHDIPRELIRGAEFASSANAHSGQ